MATSDLTTQDLHNIRAFANRWGKIIARRAYGETGPGLDCDLLAMEQLAQAAAQGVLEGTLSVLLEQQAQALDDHQPCPQCQQPCLVRYQPRPLHCRGGTLTYHEPVCHCSACRRDFFPLTALPASGQS